MRYIFHMTFTTGIHNSLLESSKWLLNCTRKIWVGITQYFWEPLRDFLSYENSPYLILYQSESDGNVRSIVNKKKKRSQWLLDACGSLQSPWKVLEFWNGNVDRKRFSYKTLCSFNLILSVCYSSKEPCCKYYNIISSTLLKLRIVSHPRRTKDNLLWLVSSSQK